MTTITYCKGLPTPADELNPIGFTELEMFLTSLSDIFYQATVETVNHLLNKEIKFNQSSWNSLMQEKYGLSKRYANGVIALARGKTSSAKECRKRQIKQLKSRVQSGKDWVARATKKINLARKFYGKKNWQSSKNGCNFPLSSNLKTRKTNWHHLRQGLHQKKRYIHRLQNQIKHLLRAKIRVKVSRGSVFIVGSKDESYGNQTCQWSEDTIKLTLRLRSASTPSEAEVLRVPDCLEAKFGKYVTSKIGSFSRQINRLPNSGAKTWHFYRKENRWVVAVQFTPAAVEKVSREIQYGALGIDLNPSSIGWAYVDGQGNLKAQGTIPFQTGLPKGKQDAQLVDVCLKLSVLARDFKIPVLCENLDFSRKKAQLRERTKKYARMLSAWAYSRFYQILSSILSNRGITIKFVNPAYTSLIGLVKYSRMYGLSSDVAAALAIARRGMNCRDAPWRVCTEIAALCVRLSRSESEKARMERSISI
ncbi:hypothetical protein MC7420_3802 [Coleofasciculus chthonoplastes PCC 7420]|uniref:Transposase DNA-binding domain family n=1 Tax=Coleofasciculus chthonoplastes PCC 7420 TaxID=118168 RepID=B4VUJ2_9CYAN|nr:hypothetical protein MC7420_3802 [Coleofasciculus chthonoplastes PCC 7420]